jgi:hypothetical protein
MSSLLPDFYETCSALDFILPPQGLQDIWDGLYSWNCTKSSECHRIPHGFQVFTLRQLVSRRVDDTQNMLCSSQITLRDSKAHTLFDRIRKNSKRLMNFIPSSWSGRFKTTTVMYRNELSGAMEYIDIPDRFRSPWLDYNDVSDGWARVRVPFPETPYSILSWEEYLMHKWGNRTLNELDQHNVFCAMIPDIKIRREYLSCLGIFDLLLNPVWKQSIWIPGQIMPGYARVFDLWWWVKNIDTSVYPPNATTLDHRVIVEKTNSAES